MTRIPIVKISPLFIAGVKAELAAKKLRFERLFSLIPKDGERPKNKNI